MKTIDNKLTTAKIKIIYVVIFAVFIALGAYYLFEYNLPHIKQMFLAVMGLLVLTYIFMLFLRLNYFFIQDNGSSLIVRYYSAHPILRSYKQFTLPVNALKSYKHKSSIFNLKHDLIITATSKKGTFVFPPVSLSALNTKERERVFKVLNKYTKKRR